MQYPNNKPVVLFIKLVKDQVFRHSATYALDGASITCDGPWKVDCVRPPGAFHTTEAWAVNNLGHCLVFLCPAPKVALSL